MTESLHPFPAEWVWYANTDGEDARFDIGPCATREEVIAEAIAAYEGDLRDDDMAAVFVINAQPQRVDLAEWFDLADWLESASEAMDDDGCGSDEDGCNHPLEEISTVQQADLDASIQGAIREWQRRHGLKLQAPWFAVMTPVEVVPIPRGRLKALLDDPTEGGAG